MKNLNSKHLIILLFLLILASFSSGLGLKPDAVKITADDLDTGGDTGGYNPIQTGPSEEVPSPTELSISSPFVPGNAARLAPGDALNVSFRTDYWCASGYAMEVFEDNNPQNLVCSKVVLGLGWKLGYAYGGIPSCSRTGSAVVNEVCGISTNAKDGSYTLSVVVHDYRGQVAVRQRMLGAVIIDSPKSNLAVKNFKIVSGLENAVDVSTGTALKISAEIENSGEIPALGAEIKAYYFEDPSRKTEFASATVSLNAIQKQLVEFSLDTSELAGTYVIEIKADAVDEFTESSEKDNSGTGIVSISSGVADNPDLFIKELAFDKQVLNQHETINVSAIVSNKGKQPSPLFDVDFIKLEEGIPAKLATKSVSALNVDSGALIEFSYSMKEEIGEHSFGIWVDSGNQVTESIEGNNQKTLPLEVRALRIEEEKCYDGLDNDGDRVIDNSCAPDIQLSLEKISSSKGKIFNASSSTYLVLDDLDSSYNVQLSSKTFLGDPANTPEKTFFPANLCLTLQKSDGSNALSMNFGVPDSLQLDDLSPFLISDDYLQFAADFFILKSYEWKINGRNEILPPAVGSNFYYNDWKKGFSFDPKALKLTQGDYSLSFTANCLKKTTEFSQLMANNTAGTTIKFTSEQEACNGADDNLDGVTDEGCNLTIESFTVQSSPTLDTCPVGATVKVSNTGSKPSSPVKLELFDKFPSRSILPIKEESVPSLQPGESKTFIISLNNPGANGELFAWLDGKSNAFREYDDLFSPNDNLAKQTLSIVNNEPDLSVQSTLLSKEVVRPGELEQLTAFIANSGYGSASNIPVQIIIEGPKTPRRELSATVLRLEGIDSNLSSCPETQVLSAQKNESKISFVPRNSGDERIPDESPPIPLLYVALPDTKTTAKLIVSTDKPGSCRWHSQPAGFNEMPQNQVLSQDGSPTRFSGIVPAVSGENKYYASCYGTNNAAMTNSVLIVYNNVPTQSISVAIPTQGASGQVQVQVCVGQGEETNCNSSFFLSTAKPNLIIVPESIRDEPELLVGGRLRHIIHLRIKNEGTSPALIDEQTRLYAAAISLQRTRTIGPDYYCFPNNLCYQCNPGEDPNVCRDRHSSGSGFQSKVDQPIVSLAEVETPVGQPPPSPTQTVVLGATSYYPDDGQVDVGEEFEISIPIQENYLLPGESQAGITIDSENSVDEDSEGDNSGSANFNGGEGLAFPGTCSDYIDNDGDGFIDGDDSDCQSRPETPENNNCNNGFDDDGDGLVDGDDPDCTLPPEGEICGNGVDEDGDGLDPECPPVELQQTNSEGEVCSDNLDNDLDGLINEGCSSVREVCGNNEDDDGDGLVDEVPPCSVPPETTPLVPMIEVYASHVPASVGQDQVITVVSQDGVPLAGALVKVITPSGKIFYLEVGPDGRVFFPVTEDGEYTIIVFFKGIEKELKFNSVRPFSLQFGVFGDAATSIFGETVQENIWYVPLLAILALMAAATAFNRTQVIFGSPQASKGRLLSNAKAWLAAVVFFVLPFIANKLVNFTTGVGIVILELVFLFALSYFLKERARKAGRMGKI